jgi:hypothetical protein
MDDNQFWVAIWRLVALLVLAIVVVVAGCTTAADQKVAELVAKGVNPIAARCAIYGAGERTAVTCHEAAK